MGLLIFLVLSFFCGYEIVSCNAYPEPDNRTFTGCFADTMDSSCNTSKVILISAIDGGSKPSNSTCPNAPSRTNRPDCCVFEPGDCLFPSKYASTANDIYHVLCNGRNMCVPGTAIETLQSEGVCSNTDYNIFSQYVHMSYYCVEETRIGSICGDVLIENSNSPVYVQSDNYPDTAPVGSSTCSCSIESDSQEDLITIYIIHRDLYNETSGCSQTLTIEDGDANTTFSCADNFHYIASTQQSTTSYLRLLWTNTATKAGGQFWIGFYAENSKLTLNCPAVPSKYVTTTSTTTTTTTTSTTMTTTTSTSTPTTTLSTTSLTLTSPRTTSVGTTPSPSTDASSTPGIDTTSSSNTSMVTESGKTSTVADRQLLNVLVAVTAVIGVLLLLILVVLCFLCLRSRTPRKVNDTNMMVHGDKKEQKVAIHDETLQDPNKSQTSKQRKTDSNGKGTKRKGKKSVGVKRSSKRKEESLEPRENEKTTVIKRAPASSKTNSATNARDKPKTAKPKRRPRQMSDKGSGTSLRQFTKKTRTSIQKRMPKRRKNGTSIKTKASTMELFTTETKKQSPNVDHKGEDSQSLTNDSKEPSVSTALQSSNVDVSLTHKKSKRDGDSNDVKLNKIRKPKGKKRRSKSSKSASTYESLLKIVEGSAFRNSSFFKEPTTSHRKRGSKYNTAHASRSHDPASHDPASHDPASHGPTRQTGAETPEELLVYLGLLT